MCIDNGLRRTLTRHANPTPVRRQAHVDQGLHQDTAGATSRSCDRHTAKRMASRMSPYFTYGSSARLWSTRLANSTCPHSPQEGLAATAGYPADQPHPPPCALVSFRFGWCTFRGAITRTPERLRDAPLLTLSGCGHEDQVVSVTGATLKPPAGAPRGNEVALAPGTRVSPYRRTSPPYIAVSIQLAALSERFHVLQRLHEPGAPSFLVLRPRRIVRQHRVVEEQRVDDLGRGRRHRPRF